MEQEQVVGLEISLEKSGIEQYQYWDPMQLYSWDDQNAEIFSTVDLVLWIFLLWGCFEEQDQFVGLKVLMEKLGIKQYQYGDLTQRYSLDNQNGEIL